MSRTLSVEDSVVVSADAQTIYRQLADPSQMGRWSPENRGAEVPSPGAPAVAGTVFVGSNERGRARWVTRCRVTDAEPGVRFGFDVLAIGARVPRLPGRIAHWEYVLEPVPEAQGGGTRVTERWTDLRRGWPDAVAAVFDKAVTGGRLFADFQRRNIARTLANLKADLETGPETSLETGAAPLEQVDTGIEIFVPFWGDPALLYATVESVRAQSDPDWTLVVVDDCYPDPGVAEHFAAETDPRIRYLRNEHNLGITDNYERCRELASAELMMFLGCDDLVDPDFLTTVRSAFRRFPHTALVQVGVRVVDELGRPIDPLTDKVKRAIMPRTTGATELAGEDLAVSLLRGDWLYWPSLVFRTARVRSHPFREGLPIIQDLALVIDMVAAGETLTLVPAVRFSYRRHRESASAASLLLGRRFADERTYYAAAARQMSELGWHRAARTARIRWTSRLHAVSLVPAAARTRSSVAVKGMLTHALRA